MVARISSASAARPIRRSAPDIRPAITEWPPSSRQRSSPLASGRLASTTLVSTGYRWNRRSLVRTSAASGVNSRKPSRSITSAFGASAVTFRSNSDVPNGSGRLLLAANGLWITTCVGTGPLSACRNKECSGDRCQRAPKRARQYRPQNSQNDAYQGVLSPGRVSGLDEISQPFTISCKKPWCTSLSRCTRLISFDLKTRRPERCLARSTVRESARSSRGVAIHQVSHCFPPQV